MAPLHPHESAWAFSGVLEPGRLMSHKSKNTSLASWFDPEKRVAPKFKSPTVTPTPDRKSIVHGLADVCSDDALWLVVSICEYVKETGETALFDEVVPFADEGQATVFEHLKRALDFSAGQIGPTGICKGLRADWNDCLNLGGGESAMVSFL